MGEERPTAASARMARMRASGTWGSSLTSGEFAAIRSVGFEPVGQVFGAAVFGVAYGDGYSCPRISASSRDATEIASSGHQPESIGQGRERDDHGPLGPLVRAMDQTRRTAVERMAAQCVELGGDGVVALRVSRGSFLLGGQEFTALGTAVRARRADALGTRGARDGGAGAGVAGNRGARAARDSAASAEVTPFTSDVSGQDFAKLIMAGWVPVGVVLGVAIGARHDDWQTTRQTRRWSGNREVAGWTDVVNQSRREARGRLDRDVQRLGAEGAVVASMQLRVSVRDCPAQAGRRDHIVEASILGTAVTRFGQARPAPPVDQGPGTGEERRDGQGQGPAGLALAVLPLGRLP